MLRKRRWIPPTPHNTAFIRTTQRSRRESNSERRKERRRRRAGEGAPSQMSSAVCSIPLISPIGVLSQLHVADQFPPPHLQYSTVSICMCVCVLVRVCVHVSAKAGQTSHRHVTLLSISQRPEKNKVEIH